MRGSSQTYKAFAIFLIALSHPAWADTSNWPQLDNGSDTSMCSDALSIADATYHSENFYLYQLPTIPLDVRSTLVLQPAMQHGADISGGDALTAEQTAFQKIPKHHHDGNDPRSIYWQIKARHGERFVINESAFGWRGDQYTLFSIKDNVTQEKFLEGYNPETQTWAFTPLIAEGWRPPLMMQEKATRDIWAIDVGAPYIFLSDWNIYSIGSDGAKQRCTIRFRPAVETATSLLPLPVQKLAMLLDGTLGSGEDEGTLQPTAQVRIHVMHAWANVAQRPWAIVKATPYNSREKVDAELKNWAHNAKSFHQLYQDIAAQYPKAERALAHYYQTQFDKNADEANGMAKQALDIAFRTYFVFSE